MTAPTPEERAEWQALGEAATDGPWEASRFFWKIGSTRGMPDEWWVSVEARGSVIACMPEEAPISVPNAAFIAAAREGWPRTLAALEEAEESLFEVQSSLDHWQHSAKVEAARLREAKECAEAAKAERDRLREGLRALADDLASRHGPHYECGNSGCRRRGLSGMHCADPCEEAHEDCADFAALTSLRALLGDQS